MVHGEAPSEKVATPPVACRKLGGLLPSAVRLPPLPAPGAVETPHFGQLPAVVFLAADWRGGGGRGGCGFATGGASRRNDEAREQVDGSGARGVVLSGDVVGFRRGRSGCGHVGGPGARAVGVEAGGVAVQGGLVRYTPEIDSCVDEIAASTDGIFRLLIEFPCSGRTFSGWCW